MSSTEVPWPGRSGSCTVNPASARAWATVRMLCGLPVNPCRTSAPADPPAYDHGSAPGMISGIGVPRSEGLVPPVVDGRGPVWVFVDAVHRTYRRQALGASRAQLREDDHIHTVV